MTDETQLARRAEDVDAEAPFNEATLLALRAGDTPRVRQEIRLGGELVGLALAFGDAPAELVVDPAHRRDGRGTTLLARARAAGATEFWAHGDLPGARALAAAASLEAVRTLLVLRLEMTEPARERVPDDIEIRSFRPDDVDAVVAVNGRAFASHPEQGAMDRADFERRASSDWFDPEGLFVAARPDGTVVGFHWTKVEDDLGEVYVVGVDPDAHGGGLGTALTARGLRHLWERGLRTVDLYVEGDNHPALAVYRRLGFIEHARDVLYR